MLSRVHSKIIIRSMAVKKMAAATNTSAVQRQGLLAVTRRSYGNSEEQDVEITNDLLKSEIMAGEAQMSADVTTLSSEFDVSSDEQFQQTLDKYYNEADQFEIDLEEQAAKAKSMEFFNTQSSTYYQES